MIEDKVKAVNPGSTVVVDNKGNATVTTPSGKTAVIPGVDLTKTEKDVTKPNAGNDIVKPGTSASTSASASASTSASEPASTSASASASVSASANTLSSETPSESAGKSRQQLPNTGTEASKSSVLLGALAAVTGLGLFAKRRKRDDEE